MADEWWLPAGSLADAGSQVSRLREYFGDYWEFLVAWYAGMGTLLAFCGAIVLLSKLL